MRCRHSIARVAQSTEAGWFLVVGLRALLAFGTALWAALPLVATDGTQASSLAVGKSPQATSGSAHCKKESTDDALRGIVEELFREAPKRLAVEGKLPKGMFARISDARFEICDDRLWDAGTKPGHPPTIVFDQSLFELFLVESQALVLGQYLTKDYPTIADPLGLHTTVMRYAVEQNLDRSAQPAALPDLVQQFVGRPINIENYQGNGQFQQQHRKLFVNAIAFLILHEFCHVAAEATPATEAVGAGAGVPGLRGEIAADSCAAGIINSDEDPTLRSPLTFISMFMVVSTQGVLEHVLRRFNLVLGHPASAARLRAAHELATDFIKASPNRARYQPTLDGLLAHFVEVMPK